MATLDDIARDLGVSKSTVSKALNGAGDVSKVTRKAILEKAVELGYSRALRSSSAPRIAIFITHYMEYKHPDDFGYEIIAGFRRLAEPEGYRIALISLDEALQQRISYDAFMLAENYCGGFFLGLSPDDPWMKDFESCTTPTALYDTCISGNPKVTHLGVDSEEGLDLAVGHLKSLGHTKIGYLSCDLQAYIYKRRYQAYFHAMAHHGLPAETASTGYAFHISDCLSENLPRLLDSGYTAFICSHDLLANSVLVHCSELGLRIPEDISIIGFDDIPLCRYTVPPLSTIRQNRLELGRSAFYALTSQINNVPLSTLLLHAELITRSSCGPVSGSGPMPEEI